MGNIILIGIGVYMVAMILLGLKRGMVRMGFSLLSILIVLILVNILTPSVKQLLKSTPIYDTVNKNIEQYVDDNVKKSTKNMTQTGVSAQKKIMDELPLPNGIKKTLEDNYNQESYEAMEVESFDKYISVAISDMIIGAIAFALCFIVLTILVRILMHVLDIVAKLPVVNLFNTAGGAIIGLLESIVVIWILCIVVTIFSATGWGQIVCEAIAKNEILSFIYDNNIIQQMITGIFAV